MPTDPPKNARQRALERRRKERLGEVEDEDLGMPPKTPKVRRKSSGAGTGPERTAARKARAEKLSGLLGDAPLPEDIASRRAKVSDRSEVKGKFRLKATLGSRWGEIVSRIREGEYTWEDFCEGLTPEELARGQLMDRNGRFGGKPPEFVPRAFFLHCQKEIYRRFNEKMQERLLSATDELIELSREGGMEAKDRAKVLTYLIERVMGPVPKEVVVTTEKPYEGLFAKIAGSARPVEGEGTRYDRRRGGSDGEGEAG